MPGSKRASRKAGIAGLLFACVAIGPASAHHRPHPRLHTLTDPNLDAALVVDAATGRVLFARNDDAVRHPASLTKMMTLYLLFEKLRAHKLAMDTQIPVSDYAASMPRAHLRLQPRETISVETAIKAAVVFFVLSFVLYLGVIYQRKHAIPTGGSLPVITGSALPAAATALPHVTIPASASPSPAPAQKP